MNDAISNSVRQKMKRSERLARKILRMLDPDDQKESGVIVTIASDMFGFLTRPPTTEYRVSIICGSVVHLADSNNIESAAEHAIQAYRAHKYPEQIKEPST